MNFYESNMKNGKLISDIDREDIYTFLEITVYSARKEFLQRLRKLDSSIY